VNGIGKYYQISRGPSISTMALSSSTSNDGFSPRQARHFRL
jgi:hypothetical protein